MQLAIGESVECVALHGVHGQSLLGPVVIPGPFEGQALARIPLARLDPSVQLPC